MTPNRGRGVGQSQKTIVEKLTPESILDVLAVPDYLLEEVCQHENVVPDVAAVAILDTVD